MRNFHKLDREAYNKFQYCKSNYIETVYCREMMFEMFQRIHYIFFYSHIHNIFTQILFNPLSIY